MSTPVAILSLATASPPHDMAQADVLEAARAVYSPTFPNFERMAGVFATAGVHHRQAIRPMEWYIRPLGWPERTEAYLEGATTLFVQAARAALDQAHLTGADVDIIVTVSSTGIAAPSLEARAMKAMGFRPDAARIPVFGLGCAGGATGLSIAARLAAGSTGATVLLVCVEVCTLAFNINQVSKANIVATALFGDGVAACVLKAGGEGFAQLTSRAEHTWPATLDIMGWRTDDEALGVIFDQSIPRFANDNLRPAMDAMLAAQGMTVANVGRFICHPGGMKVLEAFERALELGQGALDHERHVLSDHGNMSAPTVLFVLDRVRQAGLPTPAVVTGLGPGFTASTVTLSAA